MMGQRTLQADVLVVGGGPAGIAAAAAAAREGADVLLAEAYGFLGGMATAGGVSAVGGWRFDEAGKPLIAGVAAELFCLLADIGGATPSRTYPLFCQRDEAALRDLEYSIGSYWLRIHPEYLKVAAERLLLKAGVRLLYHARLLRPLMDGATIAGAELLTKSGVLSVRAAAVVDATGDGDVAAFAGAPFDIGDQDGVFQPMSMMFTVTNARMERGLATDIPWKAAVQGNRWRDAVALARQQGDIVRNPNDIVCSFPWLREEAPGTRNVNFTRVQRRDATDAFALTEAEIEGRAQVLEAIDFLRKYVVGMEDISLCAIAPQIGVRESRRIRGEYTLSGGDVQGARRFDDCIARGSYTLDIHNGREAGAPSVLEVLERSYDIPYRCLVPLAVDGLLVAGRCISGDPVALSSYRIMSHCMATGEAAGTAAALAIQAGRTPRALDPRALRKALAARGANI